jgi:hypothetical protein
MTYLTTVLLLAAFAGLVVYCLSSRGPRLFRKTRNRLFGALRRHRERARNENAAVRRNRAPAGPLTRPAVERDAMVRRVQEQRVADRRESLLRDLDAHATRVFALERALARAGEGQRDA